MRALLLAFLVYGAMQAPASQPAPAAAPPPGTDIYLLPITGGLAALKSAKPLPVSAAPGYDNQPNFSPDGNRLLFAANRDGKQIDIYVFDRTSSRVTQLTQTPENENSPTYVPAGAGPAGSFTVVQSEFDRNGARPASPIQRLWRFNAEGKSPQLILADINPVGYHAWIDADRLALFVLGAQGKPATLQLASVKTGKAEVAAENIGRSLHRIPTAAATTVGRPNTQLASFVHREGDTFTIKQIDIASKKIDALVTAAEGSSDRDYAWLPDGRTILMSAGTKIMSWTRGAAGWTEVYDGAAHQLGAITRLAVSPKGDAIAIVTAELKK
jgi:dipeptidyl aminopeptidase/acylaminoacyl peptidase